MWDVVHESTFDTVLIVCAIFVVVCIAISPILFSYVLESPWSKKQKPNFIILANVIVLLWELAFVMSFSRTALALIYAPISTKGTEFAYLANLFVPNYFCLFWPTFALLIIFQLLYLNRGMFDRVQSYHKTYDVWQKGDERVLVMGVGRGALPCALALGRPDDGTGVVLVRDPWSTDALNESDEWLETNAIRLGLDKTRLDIGWDDSRTLTTLADSSVDMVVVQAHTVSQLYYEEDFCRVFNAIVRVVKPGGRILLMTQTLSKPEISKLLSREENGFVVLKEFKRYTPPYGFYVVMWQVPDNKPNSIEPQYKYVPLEAIPDHHYESNAVFGFIAADIIVYAAVVAVYPWIYPTFNWPASISLDAFNNANVLVSGMIVFLGLGMIASFKTLRDKSARKTFPNNDNRAKKKRSAVVRSSFSELVVFYIFTLLGLIFVSMFISGVLWTPSVVADIYLEPIIGPGFIIVVNFAATFLILYLTYRVTTFFRTRRRLASKLFSSRDDVSSGFLSGTINTHSDDDDLEAPLLDRARF